MIVIFEGADLVEKSTTAQLLAKDEAWPVANEDTVPPARDPYPPEG